MQVTSALFLPFAQGACCLSGPNEGNLLQGSTLVQVAADSFELFKQRLLFPSMLTIVLLKTIGS